MSDSHLALRDAVLAELARLAAADPAYQGPHDLIGRSARGGIVSLDVRWGVAGAPHQTEIRLVFSTPAAAAGNKP